MWAQLVQGLLGSLGQEQGQGGGQQMAPSQGGQPGMGAPNAGLSDVVANILSQAQPRSGAIGLPQQQAQLQPMAATLPNSGNQNGMSTSNMLLPPPAGGNAQTDPMGMMGNGLLEGLPSMGTDQGGQEALPLANSGQHKMSDRPSVGQLMDGPGVQNQGADWSNMLNLTGTGQNPNAFTRMGVGYNAGGLMGALGYLLTDLSKQNNKPKPQSTQGGGY